MSEYLNRLLAATETDSDELFYNGSPDHACDILTALLSTAKKQVDFVTRRLDRDVFAREEVVSAARKCVDSGRQIRILFDENPDDCQLVDHPFVGVIAGKENAARGHSQTTAEIQTNHSSTAR